MDQAVQVMVNGHGCLVETAQFFVICCQVCQEGLSPLFRSFQFLRRRLFFGRRRLAAVFDFRQESFTVAQFLQGQGPFIGQSFAVELTKLLQRFGLLLQGFQLLFKNAGQVADAFQIAFRFGNFSQASAFRPLKRLMPATSSKMTRRSSGLLFKMRSTRFWPMTAIES